MDPIRCWRGIEESLYEWMCDGVRRSEGRRKEDQGMAKERMFGDDRRTSEKLRGGGAIL